MDCFACLWSKVQLTKDPAHMPNEEEYKAFTTIYKYVQRVTGET